MSDAIERSDYGAAVLADIFRPCFMDEQFNLLDHQRAQRRLLALSTRGEGHNEIIWSVILYTGAVKAALCIVIPGTL